MEEKNKVNLAEIPGHLEPELKPTPNTGESPEASAIFEHPATRTAEQELNDQIQATDSELVELEQPSMSLDEITPHTLAERQESAKKIEHLFNTNQLSSAGEASAMTDWANEITDDPKQTLNKML
ncbi:MAG TPA: hypothetical protein PKD79_00875 [Candidatus Doudnabacteria bacterium]|nr:hypothetical protein [Candidatus Doudnabacteria bacterium]